jgi:hypothetical protein
MEAAERNTSEVKEGIQWYSIETKVCASVFELFKNLIDG